MSEDYIIFIHRGESWYLYYTVKQARYYHPGANIVVISDCPQERLVRYAEVHSIWDFWQGAEEVSSVYEHHSVNSPEFELFCFQRWFVIRDFLKSRAARRVIHLDSDILVYDDLFDDFSRMGGASLGIVGFQGAFCMLIPKPKVISDFCDRVLRLYGEERESLSSLYKEWTSKSEYVAVSDMHALHTFVAEHDLSTLDLSIVCGGSVYDTVIHESDGFDMRDGLKATEWNRGKPHVKRSASEEQVRLKTIHCQGDSKNRILSLFTARDLSFYLDKYTEIIRRIFRRRMPGVRLQNRIFSIGKDRLRTRKLVYFGQIPSEGTGSPVIIYRHLSRLADKGWKIEIVGEWGQDSCLAEKHRWPVITLSHRRRFWPPFRPDFPILRDLRIWLWAGEVLDSMNNDRPDTVLTYLSAFSDTLSLAAVGFSKRYGLPLTTISHDDVRCFAEDAEKGARAHARHRWVLQRSAFGMFASAELAASLSSKANSSHVLPPIPEGWRNPAQWKREDPDVPFRVIYAGSIWPAQYSLLLEIASTLKRCGGKLILISRLTPELQEFVDSGHAEWVEPFAGNCDVLEYMVNNAKGLLVSYSERVEDMPWIASSFPSKLIEYSHLGLPCAIIAPEQSAVGRWARREGYPDYFAPSEMETFASWAGSLTCPDSWSKHAQSLQKYAQSVFDPESIHEQLERGIS